jgi:hypothetical protein
MLAQTGATGSDPRLDKEAERLQADYVRQLRDLARRYEEAGDIEKAQDTLRQILKVDPQAADVKNTLDELANRVFENNSVTVELDVSRGWTATGIEVTRGAPLRVQAEGTYRLLISTTLGPEGLPSANLTNDFYSGINCGQLMGVVYPKPDSTPRGKKAQPGKPFAIGREGEITPAEGGLLFLRVNLPNGTNSNGKLRVTLTGNITRSSVQIVR